MNKQAKGIKSSTNWYKFAMQPIQNIKIKMNRKQLILAALYCFILIGSVATQQLKTQAASAESDMGLEAASSVKHFWKCPEQKERVFVTVDPNHYYEATIFNKNNQIQIQILNQNLKAFELIFKRPNPVIFIDAEQNYIIVKEVSPQGAILSYFVLIIIYDVEACKFYLDYFAVNPRVDSNFFPIPADFMITRILELDVNGQFLAVIDENCKQLNVYRINIAERLNSLNDARWFTKCGEVITGGNSRVLFDQAHNQFLVDTMNCVTANTPAVYNKVPVSNLTCFPLYPFNSRVYNLIGYNFQYVSQSKNKKSMTTFLYRGYGDLPILGAAYLKSKCPIRIVTDEYNFFIAITDCDIYLSNVYWNNNTSSYQYFADTLSNVCISPKQRAKIFRDWKDIEVIVFIDQKFYFISCGKFFVYGIHPRYFTKLFEADCINNNKDPYARLFIEIEKYRNQCH